MSNQILQELSKLNIVVSKYEEATITWHESYLTVLTEKGIHIFEFSHNLQCLDKTIDFTQSLISHPKSSPAACLFTNKVVNKNLRNVDQTEMIIDHSLWPHNMQLLQEMSVIVDFKWSPAGAINYCEAAIAVLTNVGVVEIYTQHLFNWHCALQISTLLSEEYNINSCRPHNFGQAKEMTHMLATSAICWAPNLNQDGSSYFVTAQKNGNIIFWLIESNGTAKTVGTLQIESCEMQSMLWVLVGLDKVLLICSNILGQIIVFDCYIQNNAIELLNSFTIWTQKDKMVARFLQYIEINNNIVLICNKHRHLVVIMIDRECNKLGQYINNINDYRITSICKAKDEIYITTINCTIYKLIMVMENKELNMSLDVIEHQGLTPTHELYGIVFSPNKVLCAICAGDKKINCRKDPLKIETLIMSTKEKLVSLVDILVTNSSKLLTGYWDVIEALKYRCLKAKEMPSIDYNQLYEMAISDIYILKVYYILSIICDNLKKTFKISTAFELPESSPVIVKEEILVAHADKLLHKYSEKFIEHGKLTQSDIDYYIGAKKFLEYYFSKNKKNLHEVLDPKVLSILKVDSSFICQCCDEEVTGFKCINEHINMFCALTLTPIDSDNYLVCKWCNLTARLELLTGKPLCLFCDIGLMSVDPSVDFINVQNDPV